MSAASGLQIALAWSGCSLFIFFKIGGYLILELNLMWWRAPLQTHRWGIWCVTRPRGCVQHADGTDRRGRYEDGIFRRWLRYCGRREGDVCGAWSRCVYTVIPQLKISSMSPGWFPDRSAKISASDKRGQTCTTQTASWVGVKKRILWCDKALRTICNFNYTKCSFAILIEHTERIKKQQLKS